jgi:hypothetical protein
MNPITAADAAKSAIIERIRDRYKLLGGWWEGDRPYRVQALPMPFLEKIANALDVADRKLLPQGPSVIVNKIILEFDQLCREEEMAWVAALGVLPKVEMPFGAM